MAPARNKARPASSMPATPSSAASTAFQYSIHSAGSTPPPVPRLPVRHTPPQPTRQTPANRLLVDTDDEDDDSREGETPAYARSDWDDPTPRGLQGPGQASKRDSGYSELEYPPNTAPPTQGDGRETPLYAQSAYDETHYDKTPVPSKGDPEGRRKSPQGQGEVNDEAEWEEEKTAWSKSSYAPTRPRGTVQLNTVYEEEEKGYGQEGYGGYYDDLDLDGDEREDTRQMDRRQAARASRLSMASTVRDINQLERGNPFDDRHSPGPYPIASPSAIQEGLHRRGPSHDTQDSNGQAALLTPAAHQRLGRMSVAPARYTLPPSAGHGHIGARGISPGNSVSPRSVESNPYAPPGGLRFQQDQMPTPSKTKKKKKKGIRILKNGLTIPTIRTQDQGFLANVRMSEFGRTYLAYRPFITPALLLTSAMLLTLAMQPGGTLGTFVAVEDGGFGGKVHDGMMGKVGLGISGWCQLDQDGPTCKSYKKSDFVSSSKSFQIPGPDSLQAGLQNVMAALTALTWLSAVYHITSAFLHFFLLFGLSIPWYFFTTSDPLPPLTGFIPGTTGATRPQPQAVSVTEEEVVQKEVDLRIRCERPPYEAYGWVWWAWWAHRRGPVGHLFAALIGVIGLCALGIAVGFYQQVTGAAVDGKASYGVGLFVPVMALIFSVDPIVSSVRYCLHGKHNFNTFNEPPSPTPAAILLPPNSRPMRHIRKTGGPSYFANPERAESIFPADPLAPPLPSMTAAPAAPLDPETVRWLAAYPLDPDLVSLIADLRAGGESEDFVLSDVGLLYLRPETEEGDALLVPPAGQIRGELLQDAHFEVLEGGDEGGSAHWGPETMLAKMGETFWWPGIEEDCRELVEGCARCRGDGQIRDVEPKPGLTPLPFTGMKTDGAMTAMMTHGESAMAADMAFAMRKAEDDARRDLV